MPWLALSLFLNSMFHAAYSFALSGKPPQGFRTFLIVIFENFRLEPWAVRTLRYSLRLFLTTTRGSPSQLGVLKPSRRLSIWNPVWLHAWWRIIWSQRHLRVFNHFKWMLGLIWQSISIKLFRKPWITQFSKALLIVIQFHKPLLMWHSW